MKHEIDNLKLSTRVRNALKRNGFFTIKQLLEVGRLDRLLKKRGIGVASLREIEREIQKVKG